MGSVRHFNAFAARDGIGRAWHTALGCTAPQETTRFRVRLPGTAGAIGSDKALVAVAIGSSSTNGVGASDSAHTYPAVLYDELRRRWPQLAVTVINKGEGSQRGDRLPDADALRARRAAFRPPARHLADRQQPCSHVLRSGEIQGYIETIREGSAASRRRGPASC
jgi:hypothetical protein